MKKHSNPLAIVFVVVLIITLSLIAVGAGLNAAAILPTTYTIQNVSITASENNVMDIDLNKSGIVYFGISGVVSCNENDVAKIYLCDDEGSKYLVYSNEVKDTRESFMVITGFMAAESSVNACAASDISSNPFAKITGFAATTGAFRNVCDETCYLDASKFKNSTYKLQIEVSPGAVLKINRIIYK